MEHPVVKPPFPPAGKPVPQALEGVAVPGLPALPGQRRPRPRWKPALVRRDTFALLWNLPKSTTDSVLDLSELPDACIRLALELGTQAAVKRALAHMSPVRKT